MATAIAVAQYVESKHGIYGEMQLLKLVYYAQAWALTWTGRPLFEEDIEAWKLGPVTPSVWRQRKYSFVQPSAPALEDTEAAIVDAVLAHYGPINGSRLSRMTHNESPWKDAWDEGRGQNSIITKSAMRRAYTQIAAVSPRAAPLAPVLKAGVGRDELLAAAELERGRWRTMLDQLAKE